MVCNGDYVEKWSHCVPSVLNKLRDKKYLWFSFDSPTYMWTVLSTFLTSLMFPFPKQNLCHGDESKEPWQ
jgi:hypothetical protein